MNNLDPGLVAVLIHTHVAWALPYLAMVSLVCSGIDALFPQPKTGSHWLPLRKVISVLAANLGNARNANQPSLATWVVRVLMPAFRDPNSALNTAVRQAVADEAKQSAKDRQPADVEAHAVGDQSATPST